VYDVLNLDLVVQNAVDQPVWANDELAQVVTIKLGHLSTATGKELLAVGSREDHSHEVCGSTGRITRDSQRDVIDFVKRGIVRGY
jgi:hypothetical protein